MKTKTKKATESTEFELLILDHMSVMLVQRIEGKLYAIHTNPISYSAGEWMLFDLQEMPGSLLEHRQNGEDLGVLYEKAESIRQLLDYRKPAAANALTIAMRELKFGVSNESDFDLPF